MKHLTMSFLAIAALFFSAALPAQQSEDFGEYVVHYNALNTNMILPQVAQAYGIVRSSNRALLNVTILKKVMNTPGTPVRAEVTANGTNLTGQRREIALREIKEPGGAVYYVGEFPVHNMETYLFDVVVNVEGEAKPLEVSFQQQFYTE